MGERRGCGPAVAIARACSIEARVSVTKCSICAARAAGRDHVPRTRDVYPLSIRRVFRPDLVPARDVEHPVHAGHRAAQGIRIRDVSATDIDADGDEILGALRITRNRDDVVAGVDQLPGDTTANEARGARHEVLRHQPLSRRKRSDSG